MPIKLDDFYNKSAIELLKLSDEELKEAKRLTELLLRCLNTLISERCKIYQLTKLSTVTDIEALTNAGQLLITESKGD